MWEKTIVLLLLFALTGCFYYEAPIIAQGDVYIYMNIDDKDAPDTEVKLPWR